MISSNTVLSLSSVPILLQITSQTDPLTQSVTSGRYALYGCITKANKKQCPGTLTFKSNSILGKDVLLALYY